MDELHFARVFMIDSMMSTRFFVAVIAMRSFGGEKFLSNMETE
jgi:hypothetical protein